MSLMTVQRERVDREREAKQFELRFRNVVWWSFDEQGLARVSHSPRP